jgi:hypothetical protein
MEPEHVSIADAFRLGRMQVGQTRPLYCMVKLGEAKNKTDIISRCHLLKGSWIYINHDYTALHAEEKYEDAI